MDETLTETIKQNRARNQAFNFGRLIQVLIQSKGDTMHALSLACRDPRVSQALECQIGTSIRLEDVVRHGLKQAFPDYVQRGAIAPGLTSDVSWAGPLAAQAYLASEFVTYLRPMTILGRLNTTQVPMNCKFSRAIGGTSGGFVGQNKPTRVTRMSLDLLSLGFAKLSAIAVVAEELAKFSSPVAATMISADLAAAMAFAEDQAALDPDAAAIVDERPASLTHGATQISSSGTSASQIVSDCKAAMKALDLAGFHCRNVRGS